MFYNTGTNHKSPSLLGQYVLFPAGIPVSTDDGSAVQQVSLNGDIINAASVSGDIENTININGFLE